MLTTLQKIVLAILSLLIVPALLFSQDEFFEAKTTIGGYGELHYNYAKNGVSAGTKALDFHRFILFVSHSWSEKWSFKSELELEHNFVNDGQGELELEQAYINYHHSEKLGLQAGVILPSVGLINEYHEPPLFLSVERPEYSKYIIPTTWFGNGAALYGMHKNFDYRFAVMEGLNGEKFSHSNGIRKARQKGFKSNADGLLYNVKLGFVGIPGLRAGMSYSYNNAFVGDSTHNSINLVEFHAKYEANNIYSVFEIGNISYNNGDLESSFGYYFDLGYNIGSFFNGTEVQIIPWLRWTDYNTAFSTKTGGDTEKANHYTKWMLGLTVKPINHAVFKFEYGLKEKELGEKQTKMFNLGVGYMF